MAGDPIPETWTITPYLVVPGVERLLEFLKEAFDAELGVGPMRGPDGSIMHAEVSIGGSPVMMGEPREPGRGRPATLYLIVPDCDAVYRRALAAGAGSVREPADQFYGHRNAAVSDPSGNEWWFATPIEEVPPEELQRRAAAVA